LAWEFWEPSRLAPIDDLVGEPPSEVQVLHTLPGARQ